MDWSSDLILNMRNTISQHIKLLKIVLIFFLIILFISCDNMQETSKKSSCEIFNSKNESLQICQPLSDSEYKIDLKGRMNGGKNSLITPSDFDDLEFVTHLDLSNNPDLTRLPDFVYKTFNLIELNISNTKISDWSEEICQLKKLKKLIGTHNNYKNGEIPFHTFCIQNLKVLDMSHSNIRYIDEYIGQLQRLKELRLRNNNLFIVPLMIQQLPEISLVDFRNNFFDDEKINTIHDCSSLSSESEKKCREDILDAVSCIFYYEIPFLRGEPLRKIYTDLSGENLDEFESVDAEPAIDQNECYIAWASWMIDYEESPDLLEKTIRGQTLRELRYMSSYQRENVSISCYSIDWPFITDSYEPKKMAAQAWEIVPEEFRKPGFATKISSWYSGDDDYWIPKNCPHLADLEKNIKRKKRL